MKNKTLWALVSLVILTGLALAQAGKPAGGIDQALKDMENKWAAASLKNDAAAVGDIVTEDWVGVNAEGKVQTRADMLGDVKKSKLTRSAVGDMRVRMLDADAAVVTGTWSGAGTDASGKKFDTTERWTDVFVKKDGKWKCVASQSTTSKK
jgi:ketosteroid isomerase-like protein